MDSDADVPTAPTESSVGPIPRRSRAGRNLPVAIAVGLGLGAVVLGGLFVQRVAFVGVATVAILVAVWELSGALAVRGVRVPLPPVLVGAAGMLVGAWFGGAEALFLGICMTAAAVVLWRGGSGPAVGYLADATAGVLVGLYVPFLAGFAILMLRPDDGAWRVLTFMIVTVCSDVGGYAVGVLAGRHPMAPMVSPKKSWEGFAGSLVACVVGGTMTVVLALDGRWWVGVLLGVATVGSATVGDLGESMLKRDIGIKDMGTLLPGHGGIMDRLDSLLPTAPVAWLVLTALVPVAAR